MSKTPETRSSRLSGSFRFSDTGKSPPLKTALPESFPVTERLSGLSGISGKRARVENERSLSLSLQATLSYFNPLLWMVL
jgi:hypothetical protein